MMKLLVDFENVNTIGLQGIKGLTKGDEILFFYNDNSKITFDMHKTIEKLECKKDYQKITSQNQNALDFLLSTIIGRLIAIDSQSAYSIVSKDAGYDIIIKYWKSKGINITRNSTIKEALGSKAEDSAEEIETNEVVNDLFKSEEENMSSTIENLLNTRFSENADKPAE